MKRYAIVRKLSIYVASITVIAAVAPAVKTMAQSLPPTDDFFGGTSGYRGLQLLPSQDGKWVSGTYNDLSERGGIMAIPLGAAVITNAFREPDSQLGAGLKFSFENILVARKDGSLLLVDALGNPQSLFDPRLGGLQTYPFANRDRATITTTGAEITMADGGRLSFSKLSFLNYRGESLYLLSGFRTPGGEIIPITFTVDSVSKTAFYSRLGNVTISGSAAKGKVTFTSSDATALSYSLVFQDKRLKEVRGTANEVIQSLETDLNGLVSKTTDKFGYSQTFSYSGGRLTGRCDHYGACSRTNFGNNSITSGTNTENYEAISTFDAAGRLVQTYYAGTTSSYKYEQASNPLGYRISGTETRTKTGAVASASYKYDSRNRVIEYSDSFGYRTTYRYDSTSSSSFAEPLAIRTTLAGKTIASADYTYTSNGFVSRVRDNLVKVGSPNSQVDYTYNTKGLLTSVKLGDGTIQSLTYENLRFPDVATTILTNGYGTKLSLTANGSIGQLTHVPSNAQMNINYASNGLPSSVVRRAPALGTQTSWQGSYVNGTYLSSEQVTETAQGVTATTYRGYYEWDPLYRSIVKVTSSKGDSYSGMPNASSLPNAEFMKPGAYAETNVTLFKVPGVLPDANSCSVCASRVGYDASSGATVPGGSQCDPSINFISSPDSDVGQPWK
jgi:hypothetical protein